MENLFRFNDFYKSELCKDSAEYVVKQPENPGPDSISGTLMPIGDDELSLAIDLVYEGVNLKQWN